LLKEIRYWAGEHSHNFRYIGQLAMSSAKQDTQRTTLGMYWKLFRDIIFFITYSFFMTVVRGRAGGEMGGMNAFVYLFTGLAAWYLISDYLGQGVKCMLKNKGIFTKIKFPIMIIPTYETLAIFINRGITFSIVAIMLLGMTIFYDGYTPHINLFGLIYSLVASFIFGVSYSLFMSTFFTISRDFRELYNAINRVAFYFVPIFWAVDNIPGGNRLPSWFPEFLKNTPFVHLIDSFRNAISLNQFPPLHSIAIFMTFCLVLFCGGCFLQYRLQRIYADFV